MDSTTTEVVFEFGPYFWAYKNGRVERFFGTDEVPSSSNSDHGVSSKDVLIDQEAGLSARIFIPSTIKPGQKLPLLVYYHGGAFLVGSPFCPTYHNYMTSLVAEANIIKDSWAALQWVAKHYNNEGPEGWLSDHADFQRVFLAGDSAGGNTVYNMVARAGIEDLAGIKILGACLVHTYFLQERFWSGQLLTFCVINPAMDSRLSSLGCTRVLICVAEKDVLKERGLLFCETLRKSGWNGKVQIVETEGEEHVFRLFNPDCEKAVILLKRLASFFN
ncbi:hypothetical protein ACB092_07G127500 [Castanea dentata]